MSETSKAPLVMLEQMVMLLVFALAAALCLQAFVKSDAASRRIEARDRAVNLCQSTAEVLRTRGAIGPGEYPPVPLREDLTQAGDGEEAAYYLEIVPHDGAAPGLAGALVQIVTPEREELFSLEVMWQAEVTA